MIGDHAGEELGGAFLAEEEDGLHLVLDEESVGEIAKGAERKFVLDMVAEQGAMERAAKLRLKAMAVPPVGERAAMLYVAEVAVPFEVRNLGVPWNAEWRMRKGQKGNGHAGSLAGGDGV